MTKQYNSNSGALFINKKKANDKSPDHTGTINLTKQLVNELMSESHDEAIQISIAAWDKTSSTGLIYKAISLSKPKATTPKQSN